MKVKIISRNPDEYIRETKQDIHKVQRNYDPSLHTMSTAREYVRGLNAAKLDRLFAKPFVGNLDGHRDGISCFRQHPKRLSVLCSGACDGEIRIWDLTTRKCIEHFVAHEGFVKDVAYSSSGDKFITIGDDRTIKFWESNLGIEDNVADNIKIPINTISSKTVLTGISHHRNEPVFATCGEVCNIWQETRNEPLRTLKWGVHTLHAVAFNLVETALLAVCASDRSIIFYDKREAKPLRKIILTMKSNKLLWSPMEASKFTVANEDFNLYTFDTRQLTNPIKIHYDHVSAITDFDYAPTGKEFVSASYDKTIRIYETQKSHSRDVYYTKRMQHVVRVGWSLDNKYIYSGSDEMNIRLWKTLASEKLGVIKPREQTNYNYQESLKKKFAVHPQFKRILHHRQVPSYVYNYQKKSCVVKNKEKKKENNIRIHSKPNTVPFKPEKNKIVLREDE